MRIRAALAVYLVVYYVTIVAAVVTLWQTGLIEHLHRGWTATAIAVAVALGGALALTSRK